MESQLDVSSFLLMLLRKLQCEVAFLGSAIDDSSQKLPVRNTSDTCSCITSWLEAQRRLENDREELLKAVEDALKKASLACSVAQPCRNALKKPKNDAEENLPFTKTHSDMGTTPSSKKFPKLTPSLGSKKLNYGVKITYKPAYLKAPYRTEPERMRKREPTKQFAAAVSELPADVKMQGTVLDDHLCLDNSNGSETTHPSSKNLTQKSEELTEFHSANWNNCEEGGIFQKPVCTCFEKKLSELTKVYESTACSLRASLDAYGFSENLGLSKSFKNDLYAHLVNQKNFGMLGRCLLTKYEATIEHFHRFVYLIKDTDFDMLHTDQIQWIKSMFATFYKLGDLLKSASTIIQNGHPQEVATENQGCMDDPLGSWLESMKLQPSNSLKTHSSDRLMESYLSMGTMVSPLSARMFAFTGLPKLCTFTGSPEQLCTFMHLWDSLESMQSELQLLEIFKARLPELLDPLSTRPDRVSAFRQLYGLICSLHPVALKDNLSI